MLTCLADELTVLGMFSRGRSPVAPPQQQRQQQQQRKNKVVRQLNPSPASELELACLVNSSCSASWDSPKA